MPVVVLGADDQRAQRADHDLREYTPLRLTLVASKPKSTLPDWCAHRAPMATAMPIIASTATPAQVVVDRSERSLVSSERSR